MSAAPETVVRTRRLSLRLIWCLVTAELLALGVVGWLFLLLVFPSYLGIETFCLLDGPTTRAADVFTVGFAVAIVVTGFGTLAYVVARGDRLTRFWWSIPPVWFAGLMVAEAVIRLIIGAQPCTGGFDVV